MRAFITLLTILAMLAAPSAAFALDAPSLELTVKNVGASVAMVTVSRSGQREPKKTITKPVEPGGKVKFSRKETVHEVHEQFPYGWDVYIKAPGLDNCHEFIKVTRPDCVVQQGGGCVQFEPCEDCCFVMIIEPK